MKTRPELLITHDGKFHADEVSAITLIRKVFESDIPVIRKRKITEEEYKDPNIWLIDVGSRYNPKTNCYDHHQDAILKASNMLVLDVLKEVNLIDEALYNELSKPYGWISTIDTTGYKGITGFQVTSLINSFNNIEGGFELALDVFSAHFDSCVATCNMLDTSLEIWNNREIVHRIGAVCDAFPVKWKSYTGENEAYVMVYPGDGPNSFKVLSKDTATFRIVDHFKKAIFAHNAGFLAIFNRKEDAVQCMIDTIKLGKQDVEVAL